MYGTESPCLRLLQHSSRCSEPLLIPSSQTSELELNSRHHHREICWRHSSDLHHECERLSDKKLHRPNVDLEKILFFPKKKFRDVQEFSHQWNHRQSWRLSCDVSRDTNGFSNSGISQFVLNLCFPRQSRRIFWTTTRRVREMWEAEVRSRSVCVTECTEHRWKDFHPATSLAAASTFAHATAARSNGQHFFDAAPSTLALTCLRRRFGRLSTACPEHCSSFFFPSIDECLVARLATIENRWECVQKSGWYDARILFRVKCSPRPFFFLRDTQLVTVVNRMNQPKQSVNLRRSVQGVPEHTRETLRRDKKTTWAQDGRENATGRKRGAEWTGGSLWAQVRNSPQGEEEQAEPPQKEHRHEQSCNTNLAG